MLIAEDGTFLGVLTSNTFAADSVCNEFGTHGSEFASESIYNEFGMYGSEFSSQSAYSEFASTPPAIVCSNTTTIVGYVTKASFRTPRVDPDVLCDVLQASGL